MNIDMISPRSIYTHKILGSEYFSESSKKENPNVVIKSVKGLQYELYMIGNNFCLHSFHIYNNRLIFRSEIDENISFGLFMHMSLKSVSNFSLESVFKNNFETVDNGFLVVSKNTINFFKFDGNSETCIAPCELSTGFKVRNTVILVRKELQYQNDNTCSPSLFLFQNHLTEITPVAFKIGSENKGIVNDYNFQILNVDEEKLLVLAYNYSKNIISIWRLRDAVKQDYEHLFENIWNGSVSCNQRQRKSIGDILTSLRINSILENFNNIHVKEEDNFTKSNINNLDIFNGKKHIFNLDMRSPMAKAFDDIKNKSAPIIQTRSNNITYPKYQNRQYNLTEPMFPTVCLDYIHHFHVSDNANNINNPATLSPNDVSRPNCIINKGFFARDFYDNEYYCVLYSTSSRIDKSLVIIKYSYNMSKNLYQPCSDMNYNFSGKSVLDACYLPGSKLICIICPSCPRYPMLFSGDNFVCRVNLLNARLIDVQEEYNYSKLQHSTQDLDVKFTGLTHVTNESVTLSTSTDDSFRFYIPVFIRLELVNKCLMSLRQILPVKVGTKVLCQWYCTNGSLESNYTALIEWQRFVGFVLDLCGYKRHFIDVTVDPLTDRIENVSKRQKPNDYLTNNDEGEARDFSHDYNDVLSLSHGISMLGQYVDLVLLALHLVYENCKLHTEFYRDDLEKLALLNCSLAKSLRAQKFLRIYIRDYPVGLVTELYKLPIFKAHSSLFNSCPDLLSNLKCIVNNTEISTADKYPILDNVNNVDILNIFQIFIVLFQHRGFLDNPAALLDRYLYVIHTNDKVKFVKFSRTKFYRNLAIFKYQEILEFNEQSQRLLLMIAALGWDYSTLNKLNHPGLGTFIKTVLFLSINALPGQIEIDHKQQSHVDIDKQCYSLVYRRDLSQQYHMMLPIIQLQEEIAKTSGLFVQDNNSLIESNSIAGAVYMKRPLILHRKRQVCYWNSTVKFRLVGPPIYIRDISKQLQDKPEHSLVKLMNYDPIISMLYSDQRLMDAYVMLQSSSFVNMSKFQPDSSMEINNFTQQQHLSDLWKSKLELILYKIGLNRTLALPTGRGMLGLGLIKHMEMYLVYMRIPRLCLGGCFFLRNRNNTGYNVSDNDNSSQNPSAQGYPLEFNQSVDCKWPSFHNGVATGLLLTKYCAEFDANLAFNYLTGMNHSTVNLTTKGDTNPYGGPVVQPQLPTTIAGPATTTTVPTTIGVSGDSPSFTAGVPNIPTNYIQNAVTTSISNNGTATSNTTQNSNNNNNSNTTISSSNVTNSANRTQGATSSDVIELNNQQAGLVFGLALNGHLNELGLTTVGKAVKSNNDMTVMAILLGLSACNMGSKNPQLWKLISFHYGRLIPQEVYSNDKGTDNLIFLANSSMRSQINEIDLIDNIPSGNDDIAVQPSLARVSCIISAGLLYFNSGDLELGRILINDIGNYGSTTSSGSGVSGGGSQSANSGNNNNPPANSNSAGGAGGGSGQGQFQSASSRNGVPFRCSGVANNDLELVATVCAGMAAGLVFFKRGTAMLNENNSCGEIQQLLAYIYAKERQVFTSRPRSSTTSRIGGLACSPASVFPSYGSFTGSSNSSPPGQMPINGPPAPSSSSSVGSVVTPGVTAGGSTGGIVAASPANSVGSIAILGNNNLDSLDFGFRVERHMDIQTVGSSSNINPSNNPNSTSSNNTNNIFLTVKDKRYNPPSNYNMDITGPSATLCLGLMFMDSRNEYIARQLKSPTSSYLLDNIRSPNLCLRQISRCLIYWSDITPSTRWLDTQIPNEITSLSDFAAYSNNTPINTAAISHVNYDQRITMNLAFMELCVGSCFGLALKFAGTNDTDALQIILNKVNQLLPLYNGMRRSQINHDDLIYQSIQVSHLDWTISYMMLSASMIAAGTGNLELLRIIRYLRSLQPFHDFDDYLDNIPNYGFYQTLAMALGLLFLGGGKLTLDNSHKSAALLYIAFYPRMTPNHSGVRYHLQSLRHLYVLATRPRILCAIDIDSKEPVPIRCSIINKDGSNVDKEDQNGCIEFHNIKVEDVKQLKIFDKQKQYYDQIYYTNSRSWKILLASLNNGGYIFVQKKDPSLYMLKFLEDIEVNRIVLGYNVRNIKSCIDFIESTDECNSHFKELPINSCEFDTQFKLFFYTRRKCYQSIILSIISLNQIQAAQSYPLNSLIELLQSKSDWLLLWSVFCSYLNLDLDWLNPYTDVNQLAMIPENSQFTKDQKFVLLLINNI